MDDLLKRVESGGLRSLSGEEVMEFGHLYRQVTSALSTARSHGVNDAGISYLNQLASRAYGHIYVAQSKPWPSVRSFFTHEFPQSFRQNLLFITVAFLVTIVAGLFAFSVVANDPGKADMVLGPGATQMMDSIADRHEGNQNWMPEEMRPAMSSLIMTNNIRVTMMAFALGITLGLGTLYILFSNGLMLGTVAAAVASRSAHVELGFWSFVAPHGVIELTAIFIAGGAGLMIGWALLCPGDYTRGAALKLAGREALKLLLGVTAMLIIAGLIEGFVSPSMIPNQAKLAIATALGIAQFSYLFIAGKGKPAAAQTSQSNSF